MNCEMAENNLSAYLDDMLDPQLREEVAAHLDGCAPCSEVVAEYRRYDQLLTSMPRFSPSAAVRERIFSSPEFAAILQQQAQSEPNRRNTPLRRLPPHWARIALQSAAILILLIGAALVLKQNFFHSGTSTASHNSTPVIGNPNPNGIPLAAGSRVVFANDGALWSAPENGPGLAHQLTPAGITVGNVWSVSPDGRFVAYVEAGSGRIHIVRADGQNDTPLANSQANCSGNLTCIAPTSLVWSPDGKRIAYQALDGSLHLVNADGANDLALTTLSQGVATSPLWSSDGLRLAFIEDNGSVESIWNYSLANQHLSQIAASSDPNASHASVEQMYWLPDGQHPTLTWAAWNSTTRTITGIFTRSLVNGATLQQLIPTGMHVTAAGLTPQQSGGLWLVAVNQNGTPELATIAAAHPALIVTNATSGNIITGVYWSPVGNTAALVSDGGQMFLATQNGASLLNVLSNVTGTPIWSPDGTHLTAEASGGIFNLNIGTSIGIVRLLASVADVTHSTMIWSADSQVIAIATSSGVYLTRVDTIADSKIAKHVDTQVATGALNWSLAG